VTSVVVTASLALARAHRQHGLGAIQGLHAAACNLGLWMRTLTGIGTPRGLQSRLAGVWACVFTLWTVLRERTTENHGRKVDLTPSASLTHRFAEIPCIN
jgi:hypothetical protein